MQDLATSAQSLAGNPELLGTQQPAGQGAGWQALISQAAEEHQCLAAVLQVGSGFGDGTEGMLGAAALRVILKGVPEAVFLAFSIDPVCKCARLLNQQPLDPSSRALMTPCVKKGTRLVIVTPPEGETK